MEGRDTMTAKQKPRHCRTSAGKGNRILNVFLSICYQAGIFTALVFHKTLWTVKKAQRRTKRLCSRIFLSAARWGRNRIYVPARGAAKRWSQFILGFFKIAQAGIHMGRKQGIAAGFSHFKTLFRAAAVRHKNRLLRSINYLAPAAATMALLVVLSVYGNTTFALEVVQSGHTIGYVSDESVLDAAAAKAGDQLTGATTALAADAAVTVRLVNVDQLTDAETLSQKLLAHSSEVLKNGYGIFVDGTYYGCAREKSVLTGVLDGIKRDYAGNGCISVGFDADVKIEPGSYALQTLVTPEQLRALLPASVLPVKVVMRETSEQEIAFQTVEMKDHSRPATYSRVKTEGKEGVSQIVSEVTYVNGVETARKTVSETVITEPVNRQVIIGTAHTLAASKSAGATLLYPIDKSRTYISAYYGDGRGHTGMDIAGPVGTEIYAAADGVVQSVNSSGSGYGIHVVVKHDGNLATLYGHCSQLLVQPGDTIQAGQVIALSGNTGYSTGPHLHFEVRIGNTRVDPAPYLGIGN